MQSLHSADYTNSERITSTTSPLATESEPDTEFMQKLSQDSDRVASVKQLHSKHHSATCFKYGQRISTKNTCRFGMPRDLIQSSNIDKHGIIHLARNHGWVNPWNPAIASCIRSNHDISWIPTVSKSLSLIYYITNYTTKDDVSPLQMVTKAALLKQAIDHANTTQSPTTADLRLRQRGMDNFALRCFNSLSQDREVSGVQVASTLLQLPAYYTINYNFISINLWWLRQYIRTIIHPAHPDTHPGTSTSSNFAAEEPCTYNANATTPTSIFDNYKWRGELLSSFSIFEYCMLVRTRSSRDATAQDINFSPNHPRHLTHVQRLALSPSQVSTVTLQGQLTEFQAAEDSLPGGHPTTTAILNDMAEIFLGLFVPWERLVDFFSPSPFTPEGSHDAYQHLWSRLEPTLPAYIRTYANNIELLRKSKEDCQLDAILQKQSTYHASATDEDLDDSQSPLPGSGDEQHQPDVETFTTETLLAAFSFIRRLWGEELQDAQRRVTILAQSSLRSLSLPLQCLRPLEISDTMLHESSGLKFLPLTTLQTWEESLKGISTIANQNSNPDTVVNTASYLDDFNLHDANATLLPLLAESDTLPDLEERRSRVGEKPTGPSLTAIVNEIIPLNRKQRMIVERILSSALSWVDHPYDSMRRHQNLLYIGGEGGVGKSQVIKAIVAGMELVHREREVILMAPTGAAADIIGGNTYHTSLGISMNRSRATGMGARVRRLWSEKTIMIIDEVSMVSLSTLNTINAHCKSARSLNRMSTDLFGGLPVVILMGDFHQFPPVGGQALWKTPASESDHDGKLIWLQFKQVIMLDEQMRQVEDEPYYRLLQRARTATLTPNDVLTLNSRTISSLAAPLLHGSVTVTKLNMLRHVINRLQIERFALSRHQKIYIFPALHTRCKSSRPVNQPLRAEDLLGLPDQGTAVPFPGLFLYTLSMPIMILTNINTPAGLVNGATGTAVGIVVDPTGKWLPQRYFLYKLIMTPAANFHALDDLYIFCTKPPACILFNPNRPKSLPLQSLDPGVLPIFPVEASITVKGYSVRRKQVPICPAFAVTDYKIQGSTRNSATLDLKDDRTSKGRDSHRKYCSTYVQLSRLRSLSGLHLLQAVELRDLSHRPDPQLLEEIERLQALQDETLHMWQTGPTDHPFGTET